jgi:hypothetical protein
MKFDIPVVPATYAKELPLYIKNLVKMFVTVNSGYNAAENYILNYGYTSDESPSCDENYLSPPLLSAKE